MKTILSFIAAFFLTLIVSSCEKAFLKNKLSSDKNETLCDDVPACIKDIIGKLKSEPVRNPAAAVYRYEYNGQTAYYIPAACCDMYSQLYDPDCNLICNPDGGLTGQGDGKCAEFFNKRKNETLIWKDNR